MGNYDTDTPFPGLAGALNLQRFDIATIAFPSHEWILCLHRTLKVHHNRLNFIAVLDEISQSSEENLVYKIALPQSLLDMVSFETNFQGAATATTPPLNYFTITSN